MNFKVFPASLIQGQKIPLIKGWRDAATTDSQQLKLWYELYRDRLSFFGVPCGDSNGIVVLDIDVKKENGFQTLKSLGLEIPNTRSQNTPSGGRHYFFKFDPSRDTGNKVGFLPGCDIRSTGGWIAFYGFMNDEPILDAPQWLYDAAFARKPEIINLSPIKLAPEIAQGIFQSSIENIINAPPGESNDILNVESFKVGQLVHSGSISREFAESELFRAAKLRGKPDYESRATISSGLDGGSKHPLTSPFGATAPTISISIPPAPEAPQRWTPSYLTRSDLLNTSKLRKPQLFQDWSTEDISITTADGGTGKTTLKLYEAICLALGDRFLGFDCKQRGKTLYITGEDTDKKLAAMLGAIMNQMGLFNPGAENEAKVDCVLKSVIIKKDADLCLISKEKFTNFLTPNNSAMEKIMNAVDDLRPKMIVFDPIASFWGSEAALNDMNKAVTRFMSDLVDRSGACVEMINHMGKSSSAQKDMTQFAGRGGSGLPSNSRVSRVLRSLPPEEYQEMTGMELLQDQTAMLCNVNKFSDGSPLYNKPFIIQRTGYIFSRITLSPAQVKKMEKELDDKERIMSYVSECRRNDKYPTKDLVVAHFMHGNDPMSADRIKRGLVLLSFEGLMGQKVIEVSHPDLTKREKALVITDMDEKEL